MTARTMYEVYNKRTGEAIQNRRDGSLCRVDCWTSAELLCACADNSDDALRSVMHAAVHHAWDIPAGADLDVRPVSVEVEL